MYKFALMDNALEPYLPEQAFSPCMELIRQEAVHLKIVNSRQTRHGDYRKLPDGTHLITINATENKYRFLITLIHEIAHLVAFKHFGRNIKPHGKEWKYTFQQMMLPFLRPAIFPMELLPLLARHFKNPKASSSTDTRLALALKKYDAKELQGHFVFEIPEGSTFRLYNGKVFRKGPKKVKRYQCLELATGKMYLFQPHAEVELLNQFG